MFNKFFNLRNDFLRWLLFFVCFDLFIGILLLIDDNKFVVNFVEYLMFVRV